MLTRNGPEVFKIALVSPNSSTSKNYPRPHKNPKPYSDHVRSDMLYYTVLLNPINPNKV